MITGINGFSGSYLAESLLESNLVVYGMVKNKKKDENIKDIKDKIILFEADLRDAERIQEIINQVEVECIYHLAAQSSVPSSWKEPAETFHINIIGTLNLLEAIRHSELDPIIHIAGSSQEYGRTGRNGISEGHPLHPVTPYGVSKVGQSLLGYQYYEAYGMKVIRTRAFNLMGPRAADTSVTSNLARQIVEIERGKKEPELHVGDINARRDFTDVRDIVRAYSLAVEKCDYGEVYNICSGKVVSVKEIIDTLLKYAHTPLKIKIKHDPTRRRPSDLSTLVGDYTKFKNKTGWCPIINFEKTIRDILDYWRER
jgi:GDP-4-dehydro-6-deoxy-D-mannose reductase